MTDEDFVATEVAKILAEEKQPSDGLLKVFPINGTKFRANYYHNWQLLWTKCVLLKDKVVTVSSVQ